MHASATPRTPPPAGSSGSPWQLCLLGLPRLQRAGQPEVPLEPRAAALLALVALQPGISRLEASTLLWPDSRDPRRNLRQQLLRFRQQFGHPLVQGEVQLQLAPDISCLCQPGPAVGENPPELLAGMDTALAEDLAQWLAHQRRAQHQLRLQALAQQWQLAVDERRLDDALQIAQARLAADPLPQAHHRALMQVHYLRGEPEAALAVHAALMQQLAQQPDGRPERDTVALLGTLRQALQQPRLPGAAGAGAPVAGSAGALTLQRPPRLVGREREWQALQQAWADARPVLLEGEPGLGKTRLLDELSRQHRLARVQGRPGDQGVPYATLSRLLQALAPGRGAELPASSTALALQRHVRAQLQQAAPEGVAVDDLHFADAASVELLQLLAQDDTEPATGTSSLRWLFAQRPNETDDAAVQAQARAEEAQALRRLALAPLDEARMAELIDSLGLPELDAAALAPALHRHTGGNPLFALETLRHGLADGSLASGRLPRPEALDALVARRLRALPELATALAQVAVVAGADFQVALAEHVIGLPAVRLAPAWQALEDAQVLRGLGFAHDLVADAVARRVPAPIAARLHGQVAQWLQQHGGQPARIGDHWLAAGEPARAAEQWVLAAQRAQAQGRAADAAGLLERALQQAGFCQPADRHAAAQQLCLQLWDVDLDARLDRALQWLDQASDTALRRAQALQTRVASQYYRGDFEAVVQLAGPATQAARAADAQDCVLVVASTQARALARLGRVGEAVALLRAHQPLLAQLDEQQACDFHGALGSLLQQAGRLPEAQLALQESLALAQRLDRKLDAVNLAHNLASCQQLMGHAERALQAQLDSLRQAAALEAGGLATQYTAMGLATTLLDLNRYTEAWPWIERAEADLQASAPAYLPMAGTLAARWALELGQAARAEHHFSRRPLPDGAPPFVAAYRHLLQAQVAHALGRAAERQAAFQRAWQAAQASGRPNIQWEVRLAAALAGEAALAGDLAELQQAARALGFDGHQAAASAWRGEAAAGLRLLQGEPALSPRWLYRGQLLAAALAPAPAPASPAATGARPAARPADDERSALARAARRWLDEVAARQVPPEFQASFEQRQAANLLLRQRLRDLLG